MAVTTVTPAIITLNAVNTSTSTGLTAIDAAKTISIAGKKNHKLLIMITSSHNDTALTMDAGDYCAAGVGSASFAAANGVSVIFIVDEDRFRQNDGTFTGSWATNSAGYIGAWYLPD